MDLYLCVLLQLNIIFIHEVNQMSYGAVLLTSFEIIVS